MHHTIGWWDVQLNTDYLGCSEYRVGKILRLFHAMQLFQNGLIVKLQLPGVDMDICAAHNHYFVSLHILLCHKDEDSLPGTVLARILHSTPASLICMHCFYVGFLGVVLTVTNSKSQS